MQQKGAIQIIEWEDLDKRKFYSLGVLMTLTTRASVYPASLIRTRLQVQKGASPLYSGTLDAFCKILRAEGVRGLYRGFLLNTLTLASGQAYITTYELVRQYVSQYRSSNTIKSVVAGGAASLVAQTITVPVDVVSQQLMMQGQGQHLTRFKVKPKMALAASGRPTFGQTRDITLQIFAADGLRGFYRGYLASLLTYIPNSALWWPFYHFYAGKSSSECFPLSRHEDITATSRERLYIAFWSDVFYATVVYRAAVHHGAQSVSPPAAAGRGWTNGSSHSLHHHQPNGRGPSQSAGRATPGGYGWFLFYRIQSFPSAI